MAQMAASRQRISQGRFRLQAERIATRAAVCIAVRAPQNLGLHRHGPAHPEHPGGRSCPWAGTPRHPLKQGRPPWR